MFSILAENLTWILLIVVAIAWLYWLWMRRGLYKFAISFPGVWGLPYLGNLLKVKNTADILPMLDSLFKRIGVNTFCSWFGLYAILITADPEIVESILTSPDLLNKPKYIFKPIRAVFGDGLLTLQDNKWKTHRKLLNPAFQHDVVLGFTTIFQRAMKNVIDRFNEFDDENEHELLTVLRDITINMGIGKITFMHLTSVLKSINIGIFEETTMGKNINKKDNEKIVNIQNDFKKIMEMCMLQIVLSLIGLGFVLQLNTKYREAISKTQKFVRKMLHSKLSQSRNSTEVVSNDPQHDYQQNDLKMNPKTFIDRAIQIYQNKLFTYDEIIGETYNIMFSSFETTANSLFTVIVMLAMHPHIQEQLFSEINTVFPETEFQMEYKHLQQLPYLDMVFNEAIRLVPPITIFSREAIQETKLNEYLTIPSKMLVCVSAYHMHRRTDIWGPNADKFDPNHFLSANINAIHPYAFIPFSKGPRKCIGWSKAMFYNKIILTGLVRKFKFTTDFKYEDLKFAVNIVTNYVVEPKIKVKKR